MQGLTLTYLERGETPELMETIDAFQAWLGAVLPAPRLSYLRFFDTQAR